MRNLSALALILLAGMALSTTASAATGPMADASVDVSVVVSTVSSQPTAAQACSATTAPASLVSVAAFGTFSSAVEEVPRCYLVVEDELPDGTIISLKKEIPCP